MKENLSLVFTGFIQVFFVALNTYLLSQKMYEGVFIASFIISLIWSYNVKKIAFGNLFDRLYYSLGAAIGGIAGLKVSVLFINYI